MEKITLEFKDEDEFDSFKALLCFGMTDVTLNSDKEERINWFRDVFESVFNQMEEAKHD